MCVCVCVLNRFSTTLRTAACQTPLSVGFYRQEYWNGLPCPLPGDLPDPEIEPASLMSPALAGGFFTTSTTWKPTWYIPPLKISRFICHPSTLILHSTTTNFTLPWTWQTLVYCHLVCPPPLMLSPIPLFWQTPMHAARPSLSIPSEAFIELLRQSWMFPFLCHYHALYMCCAVLSRSVMCNSLWPHAL